MCNHIKMSKQEIIAKQGYKPGDLIYAQATHPFSQGVVELQSILNGNTYVVKKYDGVEYTVNPDCCEDVKEEHHQEDTSDLKQMTDNLRELEDAKEEAQTYCEVVVGDTGEKFRIHGKEMTSIQSHNLYDRKFPDWNVAMDSVACAVSAIHNAGVRVDHERIQGAFRQVVEQLTKYKRAK